MATTLSQENFQRNK
jgi:hypothetical protein